MQVNLNPKVGCCHKQPRANIEHMQISESKKYKPIDSRILYQACSLCHYHHKPSPIETNIANHAYMDMHEINNQQLRVEWKLHYIQT